MGLPRREWNRNRLDDHGGHPLHDSGAVLVDRVWKLVAWVQSALIVII